MSRPKSGSRTLLMAVVMNAPGPLIVGLGLLAGRSSIQISDFVRRSSELLTIIMAIVVYKVTARDSAVDEEKKAKLERLSNAFMGAMMCIGGSLMIALSLMGGAEDKGNVIPGLCVAVLGVIANTLFWRKYTRLNKAQPNAILAVQARLYRAKSLVDSCVTIDLLSVAIAPGSQFSVKLDFIGSIIVAVYLVWCGIQTICEAVKAKENQPCQNHQTECKEPACAAQRGPQTGFLQCGNDRSNRRHLLEGVHARSAGRKRKVPLYRHRFQEQPDAGVSAGRSVQLEAQKVGRRAGAGVDPRVRHVVHQNLL